MDNMEFYQSPFSWRYASQAMRRLWSERTKRLLWRKIWVALAETQMTFGLTRPEQVADLHTHADDINFARAFEIESEIHHDLMAELKTFAEQCPVGGGILHLGATSMDIEDNADAIRLQQAMDMILAQLQLLLSAFADRMDETADIPVIAFTHLQPAEPTTLGYRLATYAQDLLMDRRNLQTARNGLLGKGFKGAVGTAAAYADLIGLDQMDRFEKDLSQRLGMEFFPVTTQTYPRKMDYFVLSALAGMGATLYKFAFDLRLMQSPSIGEWSEPFSSKQVGSSAMPFKRNPIHAEKMDSLARTLSTMPQTAWQNAANSLLERTLDDSANRRSLLPEAFLICDELLSVALRLVKGMTFNQTAMDRNLAQYAPFAATERVLMALVRHGADRQLMHEKLRGYALAAWKDVQANQPNSLQQMILADSEFGGLIDPIQLTALFEVQNYTGIAPEQARAAARRIRQELKI